MPYFVLTDLDLKECPPALISEWLSEPRHPNLIFRIAVREVESGIMADHQHFSKFFGVSMKQLPENCDTIRDPKVFLKDLILRSRKKSFRKMLPESGSTAKIGNEYNSILSIFITDIWDHEQAREHSDSLNRAIISLEKFTPSWQEI